MSSPPYQQQQMSTQSGQTGDKGERRQEKRNSTEKSCCLKRTGAVVHTHTHTHGPPLSHLGTVGPHSTALSTVPLLLILLCTLLVRIVRVLLSISLSCDCRLCSTAHSASGVHVAVVPLLFYSCTTCPCGCVHVSPLLFAHVCVLCAVFCVLCVVWRCG